MDQAFGRTLSIIVSSPCPNAWSIYMQRLSGLEQKNRHGKIPYHMRVCLSLQILIWNQAENQSAAQNIHIFWGDNLNQKQPYLKRDTAAFDSGEWYYQIQHFAAVLRFREVTGFSSAETPCKKFCFQRWTKRTVGKALSMTGRHPPDREHPAAGCGEATRTK